MAMGTGSSYHQAIIQNNIPHRAFTSKDQAIGFNTIHNSPNNGGNNKTRYFFAGSIA